MLEHIPIESVLFLDIETAPASPTFSNLSLREQQLWAKKTEYKRQGKYTPEEYYAHAGIFAEFGKIICISIGYFNTTIAGRVLRLKSIFSNDESLLLNDFSNLLNVHFNKKEQTLCAHNGKEFDFPYIARRMLVNAISIPSLLDVGGKKPWEVNLLDTMELWKFGDYKHYTSLDLLAHIMGVPSPKDDIDGSMVGEIYWRENDLSRISSYCEKDVLTVAQLFLRYKGLPLLQTNEIINL